NTKTLAGVGLVSGAVFSDLEGDGHPDLVLACEWGPVRIFRSDHGKLVPWDPAVTFSLNDSAPSQLETPNSELGTLSQLTGWWNGVTTGDFNGDGRLDIVVTGWGLNTRYQSHLSHALELIYGDFDGDGTVEGV